MPFTSRGIRTGIEKLKVQSGRQTGERDRIGNAIARLSLDPDLAIKATNEIYAAKDRYAKAVELLGVMRADKIRTLL